MCMYYGLKSDSHLSEYGKKHRIRVANFWVSDKYYDDIGKIYREKLRNILRLIVALTLIVILIGLLL